MTINNLISHQVFQRTDPDAATVTWTGPSTSDVHIAVLDSNGKKVSYTNAPSDGTTFSADLTLPVGGPYRVEVNSDTVATGVLVGDIFVLAGQSNMQGVGLLSDVEAPCDEVNVLGMDRKWANAIEPLHWIYESPDLVHWPFADPNQIDEARQNDRATRTVGAGLGLAFGRQYFDNTSVPVGLIATALSGSPMSMWTPVPEDHPEPSLYASMLRSVTAAGGRVAGVLWYQGESDATPELRPTYENGMRDLTAGMRRDLGEIKIAIVQLGRVCAFPDAHPQADWTSVREAQADPLAIGADFVATAVDLALDDHIHVSTSGLRRLGRRLANLMSGQHATPSIASVEVTSPERIYVRVDGVTGSLRPDSHIPGFTLFDANGLEKPAIYEVCLASPDVIEIRVSPWLPLQSGDVLWYGWGTDPYCCLTDAADMALPARGPIPLDL